VLTHVAPLRRRTSALTSDRLGWRVQRHVRRPDRQNSVAHSILWSARRSRWRHSRESHGDQTKPDGTLPNALLILGASPRDPRRPPSASSVARRYNDALAFVG
jgi:hypothetical protein